jgi:hypothetical protein
MPVTAQQTQRAHRIDTHVRHVLAAGRWRQDLTPVICRLYGDVQAVVGYLHRAEMDALCERYDGFYRFARLMERLAEGSADDSIPVPE